MSTYSSVAFSKPYAEICVNGKSIGLVIYHDDRKSITGRVVKMILLIFADERDNYVSTMRKVRFMSTTKELLLSEHKRVLRKLVYMLCRIPFLVGWRESNSTITSVLTLPLKGKTLKDPHKYVTAIARKFATIFPVADITWFEEALKD